MKINENSFPAHPWPPMAMSSKQKAMCGIVFVTNWVPSADLYEIPPPYWLPYCVARLFGCLKTWQKTKIGVKMQYR